MENNKRMNPTGDNNRTSGLRIFSLGIVTEDKPRGTDIAVLYPIEELPIIDGSVKGYSVTVGSELPEANDVVKKATSTGKATIKAKWIPLGDDSNRNTPPDLIANETVLMFRFSDTDVYYWTALFREPLIRRKETVCYMFGNLEPRLVEWDKSTSYWHEYSTHDKHIWTHTSKSDGEDYEYDIVVDTRKNWIEHRDDVGNHYKLKSDEDLFLVETEKKVHLKAPKILIEGDDIEVVINSRKIELNARESITLTSPVITLNETYPTFEYVPKEYDWSFSEYKFQGKLKPQYKTPYKF